MRTVTRRTFLALLTASLLLVGTLPALHAAAPAERSARVTLLQLNDLYDIMPVEKGKKGGLARIATLRDRIAKESPDAVLVLAGDFLSPSTMSSVFQGSQMVAGLNSTGIDLVTFGNHEFDFGEQVTLQRMRESRFTWVSSNVLDGTGLPFGSGVVCCASAASGWPSSASPPRDPCYPRAART
jgi:5'-nucleotidase